MTTEYAFTKENVAAAKKQLPKLVESLVGSLIQRLLVQKIGQAMDFIASELEREANTSQSTAQRRIERLEGALREIADFGGDHRTPVQNSAKKSSIARAALQEAE